MFLALIAHATLALGTSVQSPLAAGPAGQQGLQIGFQSCHIYNANPPACDPDDPSDNEESDPVTGPFYGGSDDETIQFVPVGSGNDKFHIAYSTKKGRNCGANCGGCAACGTRTNNVLMSVFELSCSEPADVLVFGTGYGCRRVAGPACCEGAQYTPQHDAALLDLIIRGCLRLTGTVKIDIVVPHAHKDHISPESVHALENLGYVIRKIFVHTDDKQTLLNINSTNTNCDAQVSANWTTDDTAKVVEFGSSNGCQKPPTPACEANRTVSGLKLKTTLGWVWFQERDGHTAGSVDLVLDYNGDATERYVVYGSAKPGEVVQNNCSHPHATATCNLTDVVWAIEAHKNIQLP